MLYVPQHAHCALAFRAHSAGAFAQWSASCVRLPCGFVRVLSARLGAQAGRSSEFQSGLNLGASVCKLCELLCEDDCCLDVPVCCLRSCLLCAQGKAWFRHLVWHDQGWPLPRLAIPICRIRSWQAFARPLVPLFVCVCSVKLYPSAAQCVCRLECAGHGCP